jgi:hypothetical protein
VPILADNPAGNATGAILLITSYGQIWEVISALNSSPWTAENFGADQGKAASARGYLAHSTISGALMAGLASWVAKSWWPITGGVAGITYAWWIYTRALRRAQSSESTGWGTGKDLGLKRANWGHGR